MSGEWVTRYGVKQKFTIRQPNEHPVCPVCNSAGTYIPTTGPYCFKCFAKIPAEHEMVVISGGVVGVVYLDEIAEEIEKKT